MVLCSTRSTTIQGYPLQKENHQQEIDDKEDNEEAATVIAIVRATAATGEGNNCVGSIHILLALVYQRRKRNQINNIKLM